MNDVFDWIQDVRQFGMGPRAYREFRELLQPDIKFKRRIRWPQPEGGNAEPDRELRVKDFVDWDLVLRSGQDTRHHLDQLREIEGWPSLLVKLLPDFTSLLKDALELMAELDGASEQSDLSYLQQPSISEHPQNQHFEDWTLLIDLCRDAWIETLPRNIGAATAEFDRWREIEYPVFRRLCLFAARTSEAVVSSESALDLLSQDESWWLWSVETQREAIRLICTLATRLDVDGVKRLTDLILKGPPRSMFKVDLEAADWRYIQERTIWLRLAKFQGCGAHLSDQARTWLATISATHPDFKLQPDERDEFPTYISTGGPGGWRQHVTLPSTRTALAAALRDRPPDDFFYEDNWRALLETKFPVAVGALLELARGGDWPNGAWQEALQYLSGERVIRRAWNRLHGPLASAPAETVRSLEPALTWWLQSAATAIPAQAEPDFLRLVDRVYTERGWDEDQAASLDHSQAINHPAGHLTEALLRWWYRTGPKVGGLLPAAIRDRFSLFLRTKAIAGAARVCLAAHLGSLFVVDPAWAKEYLLPYFNWATDPTAAHQVWDAYLGNPNISPDLIAGFKAQFLETAKHYEELGEYGKQYAGLLAISLLELPEAFTAGEAREALQSLGRSGLADAAHRVAVALASVGEQSEEYWRNRVKPLLEQLWPKSASFRSSAESCALAEICVHAGRQFGDAFNHVRPWLQRAPQCHLIAMHLARSQIPQESPALALGLLAAIVDTNERWSARDLKGLLDTIERSDPTLGESLDLRRLRSYVEQYA
jgi:hypothetical protein